jgi:hypothetical protein
VHSLIGVMAPTAKPNCKITLARSSRPTVRILYLRYVRRKTCHHFIFSLNCAAGNLKQLFNPSSIPWHHEMTKQYGRIFKFYGLFGVSDSIHQSAVQRQVVQFTSIVSSGQASLCHRSPSATSYHRQGSRHIRASTHFY